MRSTDFDYHLPAELIAQHPLPERSASRLLVVQEHGLVDTQMAQFADWLQPADLVVFNDTRVIPARARGFKTDTGGRLEILIERILDDQHMALAMLRASKTPAPGTSVTLVTAAGEAAGEVIVEGREGEFFRLRSLQLSWSALLARCGEMPLPPYISRAAETADSERYQSLLAQRDGAVAAPTASLHFDAPLLARVRDRVAACATATLHVGAGTFQPVRVDDIRQHQMHAERYEVSPELVHAILATRDRGGRVVAIGTTVVRALETAAREGQLVAGASESRLFITPGFRFQVVDALLTNFHLPRSTLLMLVSALAGTQRIREAYAHAIAQRYRFFSYGDAMFLSRAAQP